MDIPTSHHARPTAFTAGCQWKRGRPVTSQSATSRYDLGGMHTRAQSILGESMQTESELLLADHSQQATSATHADVSQVQAREATTAATGGRSGLWSPSEPLRFAPTAPSTTHRSTSTATQSSSVANVGADIGGDASIDNGAAPTDPMQSSTSSSTEQPDEPESTAEQEGNTPDAAEDDVDEFVPLTYQIPEDKLRAAMLASENTRASYWSANLYKGPDGQPLSIHYCKSMEVAERVAQHFLKEKVVGFDIEWKPWGSSLSIKQNASLIQLACEDRIALFHVSLFTGTTAQQLMPPTLKTILESPDIYKVGVAIKSDFKRLEKHLGVKPQGVFELSRLHNLVEWYAVDPSKVSHKLVSLATQVLQHLQLPLYKGGRVADGPENASSVRESDWSLPLNFEQIHYAASDAYAGFRLYYMLEWKRTRLRPIPPAIGLCDYDNKRAPGAKAPQKKTKQVSNVKGNEEPVNTSIAEVLSGEREETEDAEDVDDYETAQEELLDSHQLEDPASTKSGDAGEMLVALGETATPQPGSGPKLAADKESSIAQASRRVGRLNLSRLQGPDPAYPTLPQEPDEDTKEVATMQPLIPLHTRDQLEEDSAGVRRLGVDTIADDDEFADVELEEALQALNLDSEGILRDFANDTISVTGKLSTCEESLRSPPNEAQSIEKQHEGGVHKQASSTHMEDDTKPSKPSDNVVNLQELAVDSEPSFDLLAEQPDAGSTSVEYILATTWAQGYLKSTIPPPTSTSPSRIRATVPHLRAYHLWHHQKFLLDVIAKHLRDPPLSQSTVTSYILQAITLERLEYNNESMRQVIMALPLGLRKTRWKGLAEKVGVT
jgi:ribonuclease D